MDARLVPCVVFIEQYLGICSEPGEGCDVFQGYYFAKPMSVWDYEDKYISTEG
jgi:c-di-GMP-related signal transduction protein